MKQRILFTVFFSLLIILSTNSMFAQKASPTPTPTPTSVSQSQQAQNDLLQKIESSNAAKTPSQKRGIIGTVTDNETTHITITDINDNIQIVDISDLTKFSSPNGNSSFGISDITKGMTVGVLGHYYKDISRTTAYSIDVITIPTILHGVISDIDKTNFNFTVTSEDNKQTVVSVETVTKIYSYTKTDGILKSGFSKLAVGENVIVVGFPDAHNKKNLVTSRIFVFPDLPANPQITLPSPALNPSTTIVPSTGSGKKLTPIVK